ncbi:MAG: hypothetical protein SFU83_01370 [Meiothermus sp.]|nr:hypothetical protein [Meiothermus sp.]
MSTLGRIALFASLILLVIGVIIATINFINIRDYLVALSANRTREFLDVNPRLWLTYLIFFLGGLTLGVGIMSSFAGRRGNNGQ